MKTPLNLILGTFIGASCICEAQSISSQPIQITLIGQTPYAIAAQDANSHIWQTTDYQLSSSGVVITNTHSYTEVASGLNHWVNGQWVASSEQIDILPNGTAVATNGQHQAYFPGDIYEGQIELVTPDGQQLQSRPLALAYFDGTNTVVIAELTNSIGLVGNNQVIYPNAFTDFKVDLRYTYTKAGFEQDIVLRQQPPTPESLGLNGDTARLQIMTEFFSAPQPTITSSALPSQAGVSLTDESLIFGTMQMVPGRAFLMGQSAQNAGAMVSKHWLIVNGRQVLIEEVPVDAILEGLAALPLTAMNSGSGKHSHTASKHFKLPPKRLTQSTSKAMLIAKTDQPAQGFVLDYQTINTSQTNITFQGDTTYYISGAVNLSGTNTFEGGTVIKYASGATLNLTAARSAINWAASAYRPVILTAKDDNTVGENIGGSTGTPTNYYANPALAMAGNAPDISYFRIAYAQVAISATGTTNSIKNGQIINCQNGIYAQVTTTVNLENLLFDHVQIDLYNLTYDNNIYVQNSTFNYSSNLTTASGSFQTVMPYFTNCIFVNISQLTNNPGGTGLIYGVAGAYNGFYNCPSFGSPWRLGNPNPFQSVGGGSFYLPTNSNFHNFGTTNIDPTLLVSIKQKTTYPPFAFTNLTISTNLTLGPQALRDTNSSPDLGYHYDPIDYLVDQFGINNATLILTNGVAIAGYNEPGIQLQNNSAINSTGTALTPNWFIRYQSVQEQSISLGGTNISNGQTVSSAGNALAVFEFSKFTCPALGGYHLDDAGSSTYVNLLAQNCEFYGGQNDFSGTNLTSTAILINNLFWRSPIFASNNLASVILRMTNNLLYAANITLSQPSGGSWSAFNNDFDTCTFTISSLTGYNAFLNCFGSFTPPTDFYFVSGSTLAYQAGPLGNFYQPTNSPLIDIGSTNANLVGLFYYTTSTNEMIESSSIVDIGYHYAALDFNGNPLYLGDLDGNGLPDSWEIAYFGHIGNDPNGDPDGDGLTNLQEYQGGTNPTVDDSTVTGSRANYIYDAGGWLNQVSGIRSGTVSPDSEGNIKTVSQ